MNGVVRIHAGVITVLIGLSLRGFRTAKFLALRFESSLGVTDRSTKDAEMDKRGDSLFSFQSFLESRLVGFAMHHRRSGEVDVVSETNLARSFQQPKQRSPFVCSASTADDNDYAMVRPRRREMEKVVAVAGQ